jgi:hypothetical protein
MPARGTSVAPAKQIKSKTPARRNRGTPPAPAPRIPLRKGSRGAAKGDRK